MMVRKGKIKDEISDKKTHSTSRQVKRKEVKLGKDKSAGRKVTAESTDRNKELAISAETTCIDVSKKFDEVLEVSNISNTRVLDITKNNFPTEKSKAEQKIDFIKKSINNPSLENEIVFGDFPEIPTKLIQKDGQQDEKPQKSISDNVIPDEEIRKAESARLELNDFRNKLLGILRENGGKVTLNDFCVKFKKQHGKHIRNWFQHRKVERIVDLMQQQCTDIVEVDTTTTKNKVFLCERKALKQLPKYSSAVCGDQLEQVVAPPTELSNHAPVVTDIKCRNKNQDSNSNWGSVGILETPIEGDIIKHLDPTPREMLLLGKSARNNKPMDVVRVSDRRGNTLTTMMEFPGSSNQRLIGRERPTMAELDERVNQIRNETCRKGHVILIPDLLDELCSFYNVSSIRYLNPIEKEIRRDIDIPAINTVTRLQGKVNAFIQAFIQFRNICTLHELEEEICKMEGKNAFEELKLGPLQKQLLVYEFFKFPSTKKDIPAITTLNVFSTLWKCLDPKGKDRTKKDDHLTLQEFMEYLIEKHGFSDPFESGVKIGSIALAIQVVRKAAFGDMNHLREIKQRFHEQLCYDFEQHLSHTAKQIIKNGQIFPGDAQTLVQKISGMKMVDGFNEMNKMLMNMNREACKIFPRDEIMFKFSDKVMHALHSIQRDKLLSRLFHVLLSTGPLVTLGKDDITILHYLGFKETIDILVAEQTLLSKPKGGKTKYAVAPKAKVIEVSKKWLSNIAEWNVSNLSRVESQIAAEINSEFDTFEDLGHGPFLKFIASDKNLMDVIDTVAVKITATGSSSQCLTKNDIIEFVYQCDDDFEQDDLKTALSLQFQLDKMDKPLHKLIELILADKKQHVSSSIRYLHAILCGSEYHNTNGYNDDDRVVNHAKTKILVAPYLTDLSEWMNWNLMYRSKLGNLKEFIAKKFKEKDNSFLFLEKRKDCLIKVMKDCSTDLFLSSLKNLDALMTSTCLVSIINSSGHVNNAPIALLSNNTQNVFLEFANRTDDLLRFCLQCFQLVPFEMLCCIMNKVFLDPLTKLHGRLKVQSLLVNACDEHSKERSMLHALGFHLSINEWMDDYEKLLEKEFSDRKESDKHTDVSMQQEAIPESIELSQETKISPDSVSSLPDNIAETICDTQDCQQAIPPDVVVNAVAANVTNIDVTNETNSTRERLENCQQFIEDIRREQFGIGESFGEKEQKLINVHREREGRALNRLSRELYTRDSHFVLELIQNADDNDYPQHFMSQDADEKPTVAFIVESDKVTILNNEVGFMEKNIKALCDVGKSTKGIHRKGYIGQKGIGFKSVFRVTDCPEIHSNGYHIKFDASTGSNGYILPVWIGESEDSMQYEIPMNENQQCNKCTWTTKIVLHLKKEMQHTKLTSRFHDIHPSLLMFLNRLHKIIIDDRVLGTVKVMYKEKIDNNLIQLSENDSTALWFVVNDEIPIDLREDVKTTDISVAFPIQHKKVNNIKTEMLSPQPVFAFLPLRSYGFKFIIQADFEVPSSREDIDKDSSWNQYILQQLPKLVVNAFYAFKNHHHFNNLDGIIEYFKFMDLDDHVLGIFKQVAAQISKGLQREACLPVQDCDNQSEGESYIWAVPHSVVISKMENHSVITPSILEQQLGLHYIHKDIQQNISNNVYLSLGVEKLALGQLIEIAKTLVRTDHFQQEQLHAWIGEWLYVVHTCMQENCDYSEKTLDTIKSLKIFALCDGTFVSLKDAVVFFPIEHEKKKSNKTFRLIENDLSILSHAMISNLDIVKQQLVIRLLQDLGVKTLRPFDLIHDYIIPLFKSGQWKEKADDLVIACVIYLHQHFLLDENLFEIDDIKGHIALMTNKGLKQPSCDVIYLSKEFGNPLDLGNILSACDWTLIESVYPATKGDRKSWHEFFLALGLKTFVSVRKSEKKLHQSDLVGSVWERYSETWGKTEDETYVINDLICPEFDALIQSGDAQQIHTFACTLDKHWEEYFKRYDLTNPTCLIKNTQGEAIGSSTYSSFFLKIRNLSWIQSSEKTMHVPRDLFYATDRIMVLLANKVKYMSSRIQNKDFICTLGVQTELTFEKFIEEFTKWREESSFSTTRVHTHNIYEYLECMVNGNPSKILELLDGPFFFLTSDPGRQDLSDDEVTGKFYEKKDVCWEDPSGIITRSSECISHRRILLSYYPTQMRDFFVRSLGVDEYPSCGEYLNLVSNIANKTTLPDKQACQQILSLFALLAQNVIYGDVKQEFDNIVLPTVEERGLLYVDLKEYIIPEASECLLTDSNIIPTSSNRFVSMSDKPILVLNEPLANIYKKDAQLPLVYLKDILRMLKNNKDTGSRRNRNENIELEKKVVKVLAFFKACNIPLLQDVVESPEVVPGLLSRGCATWQQTLHDIAPYIQRFIYTNQPKMYRVLEKRKFAKYLKESSFFEVGSLEVIYRLNDRQTVNIRLPKVCSVQDMSDEKAYIYISTVEDSKSKYEEVLIDLMEMFVGQSEALKEDLSDFIIVLNSVPNKENHLKRKGIAPMPDHEIIWEYPEPEKKQKPPPPPPSPVPEVASTAKVEEGEHRLTCWPPRNPNASGTSTKPESARKEEQEILEKWQPPAAPNEDNMKPAQIDETSIAAPYHNQETNKFDSDKDRVHSTSSQIEISKTSGDLKRKSSEIFPLNQVSEGNVKQSSDDRNKTTNPQPLVVANQNVNTTERIPIHNGNLPDPLPSPVSSPKKNKDVQSNFDASSIQPIELLEQYQDLPLLVSQDLLAGEDRFLQLDQLQEKAQDSMLGQIGEQIVYQHLCIQYKDDIETGRVVLSWLNNEDESGKPFDIKIMFAEHTKLMPIYVEVKSTLLDEKKEFEISSQQLKLAFEQGPCFHLYRLSGMAKQHPMKLKRLVNLATYMDNKSVKLYMIL